MKRRRSSGDLSKKGSLSLSLLLCSPALLRLSVFLIVAVWSNQTSAPGLQRESLIPGHATLIVPDEVVQALGSCGECGSLVIDAATSQANRFIVCLLRGQSPVALLLEFVFVVLCKRLLFPKECGSTMGSCVYKVKRMWCRARFGPEPRSRHSASRRRRWMQRRERRNCC